MNLSKLNFEHAISQHLFQTLINHPEIPTVKYSDEFATEDCEVGNITKMILGGKGKMAKFITPSQYYGILITLDGKSVAIIRDGVKGTQKELSYHIPENMVALTESANTFCTGDDNSLYILLSLLKTSLTGKELPAIYAYTNMVRALSNARMESKEPYYNYIYRSLDIPYGKGFLELTVAKHGTQVEIICNDTGLLNDVTYPSFEQLATIASAFNYSAHAKRTNKHINVMRGVV